MFMEDEIPDGVTTMPHQLNVVINIELGREGQPGELQGWRYGCRQDFLACVWYIFGTKIIPRIFFKLCVARHPFLL